MSQFVLLFLAILTSGLQYLIQLISYRRDLARVERIMEDARLAAWGPKMNPIEGKRKVSRVRTCAL
jgi:DnaJ homolog subfamily C member 1